MEKNKISIIGSGPAGIGCAYALLSRGVKGEDITLLEMGPSSYSRTGFSTGGFGGIGLCSDVKLCMDPSVGTELPYMCLRDSAKRMDRDKSVTVEMANLYKGMVDIRHGFNEIGDRYNLELLMFANGYEALVKSYLEILPLFSNFEYPYENKDLFHEDLNARLGLPGKGCCIIPYPVEHLGSDGGKNKSRRLEKQLSEMNVDIIFDTEIKDISRGNELFLAEDSRGEVYASKYMVVGCGKIGGKWTIDKARKLGVGMEESYPAVGVRLETNRGDGRLNTLFGDDPKIKYPLLGLMQFEKANSHGRLLDSYGNSPLGYFKTHCSCCGGRVLAYPCDYGFGSISLVGGEAKSSRDTENANLDVLYRGLDVDSGKLHAFLRKHSFELSLPIVQRLGDLLEDRPTNSLGRNSVKPTLKDYQPGNVRGYLQELGAYSNLPKFLSILSGYDPSYCNPDMLLYFPAIEFGAERIAIKDLTMESCVPSLYFVGDGSGWTQGIISAAVSGHLAGKDIAHKLA